MTPQTPLRILHVGCGGMAGAWLSVAAAHPGLHVVGLVDLQLAAAENRRAEFASGAAAGTDFPAMLREHQPDLVFNCTVPEAHLPVSLAALHAGAHVLVEKPLAHSMSAARELVAAAGQAQRLLAVTQNYRYQPSARAVRDAVAAGWLGEITGVNVDFFLGAHFGGFRDRMEHVLLVDLSIHHFDLARFFTGSRAEHVFCREWNPAGSWYRHGANAQAIFQLTGGVVFGYRGSWCAEGARTSWNGAWRITGTKGTLLWDGDAAITVETASNDEGFLRELARVPVEVKAAPGKDRGHTSIIGEFVDCIRAGKTPETAAADNIHSLAMVYAAIESASTGQPARISDETFAAVVAITQRGAFDGCLNNNV